MDLGEWLRTLSLERYEKAFRDHEIDVEDLTELTEADFDRLGIPLGPRRRLLKAIRGLATPTAVAVGSRASLPATSTERDGAERRQLTVMFCDLVGSTELSTRLDPEDLRAIIGGYHRCCTEVIKQNGGFVAKYIGDGILAYFGYPRAHEDDAERAVRAGLDLVRVVGGLKTGAPKPLQVRIGIATGLVVVGDLIGSGEAQERGVVGETPNLAARLQAMAKPNSVVIGPRTRRLLADLFEYHDIGPIEVKGFDAPVQAYEVLRASSVDSRFEALRTTTIPLVGRDEEIELLIRRWDQAKQSEGQTVLISGEAGIGKSRLTAALLERLSNEPHTRLRYFCSPQRTESPLYPVISQLERAAGLSQDDKAAARLDKLDTLLSKTSTSARDAAFFAEMLSIPNDGRYAAVDLHPQARRQRTLEALVTQVETLARQQPVLMIFEDVHWVDPTSLEVLGRIVNRIATLPVLLIVTFRSEFEAPWIGESYVTAMTINRLTRREVGVLVDRVIDNMHLSAATKQDIVDRTDGVPLFVEEVTKAVLEAESEGTAHRSLAAVPLSLAVPASLHASLMARLDRLGSAKEVSQIGAAIGREFTHALLASVALWPEAELASALNRLMAAGLLLRQGVPPHATYLFKHALVQDVAYGTLLREPRRALHLLIAETIKREFAEVAESQPELLAHHYTEAGLIEKAVGLWGQAGQKSLETSALAEARSQLSRALDQIARLPSTPALRSEQIKLQIALANALMHATGYSSPETTACLNQARSYIEQAEVLGDPPDDPLLLFSVLYGFWAANYICFNGDALRELAVQFLSIAERQRTEVPLMIGHRLVGTSLVYTGDIAAGRAHYDQAIALYRAEHRALATRFGQDIEIVILRDRSLALWMLGHPDAARRDSEKLIEKARDLGQASTLLYALQAAWAVHIECGDYLLAQSHLDEFAALADGTDSFFWKPVGAVHRGRLFALTSQTQKAVQVMAAGIEAYRSTRSTMGLGSFLSHLAKAHAELGQLEHARRFIGEALDHVKITKEALYDSEINRRAGQIALLSEPDHTKAEQYFERGLKIARQQQAKSWELRAAMSMARLWRHQGKRQQAYELLAPVYGWFTEGLDTLDLKHAQALLNELR